MRYGVRRIACTFGKSKSPTRATPRLKERPTRVAAPWRVAQPSGLNFRVAHLSRRVTGGVSDIRSCVGNWTGGPVLVVELGVAGGPGFELAGGAPFGKPLNFRRVAHPLRRF